ncbi:transcriptional regulator [Crossiella sp. CA198]|uniref:transcriptional regulator n=1 Tax=Crossiella sp. CA198 TaxID=3455607 RepID=UPI003F8D6664
MNTAALTFATIAPALWAAHHVGDYWLQTTHQVENKGCPGAHGWLAAARHVASYTAATAAFVGIVWAAFGLDITPLGFLLGQLVSAVTHLVIDRRYTLRAVSAWLDRAGIRGKLGYYDNGGAPHLDQAAHLAWLFVAALLTALVGGA